MNYVMYLPMIKESKKPVTIIDDQGSPQGTFHKDYRNLGHRIFEILYSKSYLLDLKGYSDNESIEIKETFSVVHQKWSGTSSLAGPFSIRNIGKLRTNPLLEISFGEINQSFYVKKDFMDRHIILCPDLACQRLFVRSSMDSLFFNRQTTIMFSKEKAEILTPLQTAMFTYLIFYQ